MAVHFISDAEVVDLPLVPLYTWLFDECRKRLWKRSARNGDREPVALVNGLLLSFYYVLCERIGEVWGV